MDFLGLKNLTIIQNTLRIIRKTNNEIIDIEKIPIDDELTFKLLQDAHTTGVFQLESSGMKRYLKQLKPTIFEDIIAMVALYRPGPMDYIPDFIGGKHGTKKIEYLHPLLEPILQNTYGVAVYQEQLMQIARELAGFSYGEADVLRKAVGKKILALVVEQKEKFINGCIKQGIQKKIAEKVFSFIEPFAGYGFNRSHAACYALIGYQTAYLKAHYPAEFMAALLTSDQDNIDRIAIEVREAKEIGIEVLPPHINESFEEFAVIPSETESTKRVRFGLNAIKNVGSVVAEEIVLERKKNGKYTSLENFIERVKTKDLNKKSLEALIKVGALEGFGEKNQLLESIDTILQYGKNIKTLEETHSESLFGSMVMEKSTIQLSPALIATKKTSLAWEKELLGLYVSDHPVNEYQSYFKKTAVLVHDLEKQPDDSRVRIGGVITDIRKILTKKQNTMYFIGLEDTTGRIEILVFGKTAERTSDIWVNGEVVIVDARISKQDGALRCIAEGVEKISAQTLHQFARAEATRAKSISQSSSDGVNPNKILITIKNDAPEKIIEHLSQCLKTIPKGPKKVAVKIQNTFLETTFSIDPTEEHLAQLKNISGIQSIM